MFTCRALVVSGAWRTCVETVAVEAAGGCGRADALVRAVTCGDTGTADVLVRAGGSLHWCSYWDQMAKCNVILYCHSNGCHGAQMYVPCC